MEQPEITKIVVGNIKLKPAGQIFKLGKPMTATDKWNSKDFLQICEWIGAKVNATKLSCSNNHTWIELKVLRLDSQLISKDSDFYNCAIQLNTDPGAKSKSESYSSVLIHQKCFQGEYLAHLGAAVARAHTESNKAGCIYHVLPRKPASVTPVVVVAPKTCVCPHCKQDTAVPEKIHPHEWGPCGKCGEWFEYPAELFV